MSRAAATREALQRLRAVSSNAELADRIPVELCRAGFGRVLFSLIRRNIWMVRSAHTTGDEEVIAALLRAGRAHPRRLSKPLPERAMVASKTPILVARPQSDPRVNGPLVAAVKPDVYIAAPVYLWQTPAALLHADAPEEKAGDVGPGDRDVLGVFAEGLGAIMERNIVLDRMQTMRTDAGEFQRRVDDLTGFLDAETEVGGSGVLTEASSPSADIAEHLTRREFQVLNLLAAGKTNAQIAGRLFLSEGTVKTHLRHIMDKLGAANRTDAVARYRQVCAGPTTSGPQT